MSVDILDRVYDAYVGEMGQRFMRETQQRIHWVCSAVRGESVLDVGCSQGLVPLLLAREGKTAIGIDSSGPSIRVAEEHLTREQMSVRKRVTFIEGDFAAHDFRGQKFDDVIIAEVLEHLLQPERFVEAAAQLLDEGGRLIVTVPFGINDHIDHKHTFYLLQPYRLLAKHFEVSQIEMLGKWVGFVGVRRAQPLTNAWTDRDLERLEAAFGATERFLVDEVTSHRARLDEANTKYRNVTEELNRLRRESAHNETERKSAERSRGEVEAQLREALKRPAAAFEPELARESGELRAELASERKARHSHEVSLVRLEERLKGIELVRKLELDARDGDLARANEARRTLETELSVVIERHAQFSSDAKAAAESADNEIARLNASLTELGKRADQQSMTLAQLEGRLAMATQANREATARLEQLLKARQAEVTTLQQKLGSAEIELRTQQGLTTSLQARVEALQAQAEAEAQAQAQAQAEAQAEAQAQAQASAKEAEAAARKAAAAFAEELERQKAAVLTSQRQAAQAQKEQAAAKQAERKVAAQLARARAQTAAAEERVVQARNTLSFQLGHELIHGFKSRDRLFALPKNLWALQQEAARRRHSRREENGALPANAPVIATVTAAPAPAARAVTLEIVPARAIPVSPAPRPQPTPRAAPDLGRGVSALRIAGIYDEFSFSSFAPECNLLQLTPEGFREELEGLMPDLLFIESAWRGKDDLWDKKVAHRSRELVEIIDWCRERGIPTAFWNKEDPVHFRTFINTAKLFDVVFTTDVDCIHRYKQALDHDRVFLLPFAVQPRAHNPLETFERKDAICFAGAYYARYPERQEDLASFAEEFAVSPRLEIFDRNFGKTDPDYAFPEHYRPFIVGTLAFNEINKGYKGYRYALNLNSIKGSQSMFARRVFELLASNTITVSNFSRGLRLLFGDLVITTDSGQRAGSKLRALVGDETRARRFRLAGVRKVMQEHTYAHRMRFIASSVWQRPVSDGLPRIMAIGVATSAGQAQRIVASFHRQAYEHKSLLLVIPSEMTPPVFPDLKCLTSEEAWGTKLGDAVGSATHLATLVESDYYGPHYLTDLALATRWSDAPAIGKKTHYVRDPSDKALLVADGQQYRNVSSLKARASLVSRALFPDRSTMEWLSDAGARVVEHPECLSVDEFNYCEGGASLPESRRSILDDLTDLDYGISLQTLLDAPAGPGVSQRRETQPEQIPAARLAAMFKPSPSQPLALSLEADHLLVQSRLPDEKHEYIYANHTYALADLGLPASDRFHFEASPGLNLQLSFLFLDEAKQRIGHHACYSGRNETVKVPPRACYVRFALRAYGSGSSKVSGLLMGHVREAPEKLFGNGDYLLLTNHYPSDQDLYRNAFVHRRVLEYTKRGLKIDVFRMSQRNGVAFHEFDGIDVVSGGQDALRSQLLSKRYHGVLVHFLDPGMWSVLQQHARDVPRLVWVHGAEIQAWHRRDSHYSSPGELEVAKVKGQRRAEFWRDVVGRLAGRDRLIFVSDQFAREVATDLEVTLPPGRYDVIHNVIDVNLFRYEAKPAEQRRRILSIRPHTSGVYANDLAVAAILRLSKLPFFQELEFHMVGDGPLFEKTMAPLQGFENVRLVRGFLPQAEIAQLHREYGIFLCPSRADTQGVSRDEAMSSGLVPVTNRVGAIPEFVDDACGILADREDSVGLADGIARLYEDATLFQRLSAAAAARVRSQRGPQQTTQRELALIRSLQGS